MSGHGLAARLALALAAALSCAAAHADADAVVLYTGYGDGRGAIVEGRLVEAREDRAPAAADRWWTNLRRNLRALVNDERDGVQLAVEAAGRVLPATTDDEGYFRVGLSPPPALAPGWHGVRARAGNAEAAGWLLIVPPQNTLGVISDLDDTLLVSEVTDKRRLLANSLLRNALQREAVPGAAGALHALAAGNPLPAAAPVFYLSASPRQLQGPIQAFLDHNGFPRGVLIAKRVTNDATSEPIADQAAYKTARIEEILERLPALRFVLIGDDGERDPEVYQRIRARHPQRIAAVWIRRVHPDPGRARYPGQDDFAPPAVPRPLP